MRAVGLALPVFRLAITCPRLRGPTAARASLPVALPILNTFINSTRRRSSRLTTLTPPSAAAAAAGRCSASQADPRAACADPPLARLVAEGVAASGAAPQLHPAARACSAARVRVARGDGAHVRYVDQPRGPVKRFMLAFLGVSMISRGAGAVRPCLRARLPRKRPPRIARPRLLGRTRLQVIHASLPSEPPSDRSTPPFAGSVSSRAGGLALVARLQIASFQPGLMRRAARPRMPRLSPSNHQYCEEGQGQTRSPCFPSPAADHQRSEEDGASICGRPHPRARLSRRCLDVPIAALRPRVTQMAM